MIKNIIFFVALVLISCTNKPKVDYDRKADHRLIFVGNGYTYYNQLNIIVAEILKKLEKTEVFSVRIAAACDDSHTHLAALGDDDTDLHKVFVQDAHQGKKWDLLVFQEQSTIPGLLDLGSESRMPELQVYGGKVAKKTMLMMTWAYVDGYPNEKNNAYPNYIEMQKRLASGTRILAKKMTKKGGDVSVAPVGLAFYAVYKDLQKEGKDPLAENSLFRQLYQGDGRQPTLAGSYLAACVIAALYTEKSILDMDGKPRALDAKFAKYLREVAARVVKDEKSLTPAN